MGTNSSFAIPELSPFQMDQGGAGSLSKNINLFRGDVNFCMNLVTLSGRNGLSIHLSALYESNVREAVQAWNEDAPTGVLGLGWSFAFETIAVEANGTGSSLDNEYFLQQGQGRNRLYQVQKQWKRGMLAASFINTMNAGTVSPGLVAAFHEQGLCLGKTAVVSVTSAGKVWLLTDKENERCYQLEADSDNAAMTIYAGGLAYELVSFQFWQIQ